MLTTSAIIHVSTAKALDHDVVIALVSLIMKIGSRVWVQTMQELKIRGRVKCKMV